MKFLVPDMHPESPLVSYAPPESQTKRWAEEPRIERWFPHRSGERGGCNVTGDADKVRSSDHLRVEREGKRLHPLDRWRSKPSPWRFRGGLEADAGCETEKIRRMEENVLTSSPIESNSNAIFAHEQGPGEEHRTSTTPSLAPSPLERRSLDPHGSVLASAKIDPSRNDPSRTPPSRSRVVLPVGRRAIARADPRPPLIA